MNIKRYNFETEYDDAWMGESDVGKYVLFEDYEKLYDALLQIHNYPEEDSLWQDARDDAAWEIVSIAGRALNLVH